MFKIKYICFAIILICIGCEDMNHWHQSYLDEGETVYAGGFDSVLIYSGYERAFLRIKPNTDSRLQGTAIVDVLTGNTDTIWFDVDNRQEEYFSDIVLEEGNHQLKLTNFDIYDNSSIQLYKSAYAYGEMYKSNMISQVVKEVVLLDSVGVGSVGLITWVDMDECVGNKVFYTTADDALDSVDVFFSVEKVGMVFNPKPGSSFSFHTYYCPDGGLDTLMMQEAVLGEF